MKIKAIFLTILSESADWSPHSRVRLEPVPPAGDQVDNRPAIRREDPVLAASTYPISIREGTLVWVTDMQEKTTHRALM